MQTRILQLLSSWRATDTDNNTDTACLSPNRSRLADVFGLSFYPAIAGKTVIDFGCGEGNESVEMALHGAGRVIGLDIREEILANARAKSRAQGVADKCYFASCSREKADLIISIDSFEHFADPDAVLVRMAELLKPEGEVWVSFGPTWYHPLGGHLFSIFPWAHLVFSEKALCAWRSEFKTDGATRFSEVAGGLNQMTIRRFKEIVARSPFEFADFRLIPIRPLRAFHTHLTREFTTAVVLCRLRLRILH